MRDALVLRPGLDSTGNVDVITNSNTVAPAVAETAYTSSTSDVDIEKQRSSATSSDGDVIHDHVDVQYAERQFADLKRRYSSLSRVASGTSQQRKSKILSRNKTRESAGDVFESDDEFDLEDVLRDRHRREIEHDIKPKHLGTFNLPFTKLILGVIFENLTVRGFGGAKYYIKTFPDAFVDFFNVWGTFKSLFGKRKGTEFDILKDFTGCVRPGEVSL